ESAFIAESRTPAELRRRMLEVLATLWLAKRQLAAESPTFRILLALVRSPIGVDTDAVTVPGRRTQRQVKALTKAAYEQDRKIARLERTARKADRDRDQRVANEAKLQRSHEEAQARVSGAIESLEETKRQLDSTQRNLQKELARRTDLQTRLGQAEK